MGRFLPLVAVILSLFFACDTSSQPEAEDPTLQYYAKDTEAIDINKDGLMDLQREFQFYQFVTGPKIHFYLKPLNGAAILCNNKKNPLRFMAGDTIYYELRQIDLVWYPNVVNMMMCNADYNNWYISWAVSNGIIGVKVRKDSTWQTAWVHVTLDTLRERNIIFNYSRYQQETERDLVVTQIPDEGM